MTLNYILAPRGWKNTDPIFTKIESEYTCLYFLSRNDAAMMNGTGKNGIFTLCMGRCAEDIKFRTADYLRYENNHNRVVIVGSEYDFDIRSFIEESNNSTPLEKRKRSIDPAVVVHSTNLVSLESIVEDKAIKSSLLLMNEGKKFITLGYDKLREPSEYNQYVHYGSINSCTEVIVLSQQKKSICTEVDSTYVPGARIYLDHYKMIDDGIVTRDGLHAGKVKGFIPLDKYLFDIITPEIVDKNKKSWTPVSFFEMANETFMKRNKTN